MAHKKLESILSQYPPATASKIEEVRKNEEEITIKANDIKYERIVAVVPRNLKVQMKKYLIDKPEETERSLILKGLKLLGFDIQTYEIKDRRK